MIISHAFQWVCSIVERLIVVDDILRYGRKCYIPKTLKQYCAVTKTSNRYHTI